MAMWVTIVPPAPPVIAMLIGVVPVAARATQPIICTEPSERETILENVAPVAVGVMFAVEPPNCVTATISNVPPLVAPVRAIVTVPAPVSDALPVMPGAAGVVAADAVSLVVWTVAAVTLAASAVGADSAVPVPQARRKPSNVPCCHAPEGWLIVAT